MKRSMLMWFPFIVLLGTVVILYSCKKDEEPELTTASVTKITDNSAVCGGKVTFEGSSSVMARGVCWCCNNSPKISDPSTQRTQDASGSGEFTSYLTGLEPDKTYYIRAYATNGDGTSYGNEVSFITPPLVTDIDGNVYHTVKIGDQTWMSENLNVTKYRNGDPIPNINDFNEWGNLTTGAWIEMREPFNKGYGKHYNFYAVWDSRHLAPEGWHVATDEEWKILSGTVDSQYPVGDPVWDYNFERGNDAGGNLKSITDQWLQPNEGATDKYGFSALPGGYVDWNNMGFQENKISAVYWTATPFDGEQGWFRAIRYDGKGIWRNPESMQGGGSVRCVKD